MEFPNMIPNTTKIHSTMKQAAVNAYNACGMILDRCFHVYNPTVR